MATWRGTGKSYFCQQLALSVAGGAPFLRYLAAEPVGVLLIDGEMPAQDLQKRFSELLGGSSIDDLQTPLKLLSAEVVADSTGRPMPALDSPEGQRFVEGVLLAEPRIRLVIVDSVSTLCRSTFSENEAESWTPMQQWALALRRQGYAVIFVHHAGKNRERDQRGTSRREDVLDLSIQLDRPSGYRSSEGARFVVRFPKTRGIYGQDAEPFEVTYGTDADGRAVWS